MIHYFLVRECWNSHKVGNLFNKIICLPAFNVVTTTVYFNSTPFVPQRGQIEIMFDCSFQLYSYYETKLVVNTK